MKTSAFVFPLITTVSAFLLSGCASQHQQQQSQQAYKPAFVAPWGARPTVEQPVPEEDILGAPPGSKLNWVKGYWAFADWRWFWVPGHWEERWPSSGTWVPGQWDRRDNQWFWRPGHWEQP